MRRCFRCGRTERQARVVVLVQSSVVRPVLCCMECRREGNYRLNALGRVSVSDWLGLRSLDPVGRGNIMRPKDLEPKEYGDGKASLKRNGLKKCQYGKDGHVFEIVRPKYLGTHGLKMNALPVREVYERDIALSEANASSFLKGRVFIYWRCRRCGKEKHEIQPVEEAKETVMHL